jgi:hypothetical protein
MKLERVLIIVLSLILLGCVVHILPSDTVNAEDLPRACGLQFEPGVTTLRAAGAGRTALGKVAYDSCTGNVWGFPTGTNAPYPVDSTNPNPPVSQPIYLGRFAVESAQRQ